MKPINEYTMQECLDRLYDNYDPTGVEINILELACRINTLLYEQAQRHDARVDALENKINALRDKHRWIPVSERLPTKADANFHDEVMVSLDPMSLVNSPFGMMGIETVEYTDVCPRKHTHWKRTTEPEDL